MLVVDFSQDSRGRSVQIECEKLSASSINEKNEDSEDEIYPLGDTHHENQMLPKKSILKKTPAIPSTESAAGTSSCNKNLTFSLMTKVTFVDSLLPVKDEIWWNESDYRKFHTFSMYVAGALPTSNASTGACHTSTEGWWSKIGHSRRGLESYSQEGRERQRKAEELIRAVIKEQKFQKILGGEVNHASLAQLSVRLSKHARRLALATGLADAAAANSDFIEEDRIRRVSHSVYARRATANETMMDNVRSFFFPNEHLEQKSSSTTSILSSQYVLSFEGDKTRKRYSLQPMTKATKHSAFRFPL